MINVKQRTSKSTTMEISKGSIIASDWVMLKNDKDFKRNKWIRKADAVREEINIEKLKKILNNY